jgi:glycosyltransferase involved in cell wall biosynthesis
MSERNIKIVLNSMVKNEASVIERMLESVYKYIDYWVIQDNGSTDGTPDIIRNFFERKGIPGFLYHEPWKYFGYNRNHALQTCMSAQHGCEYILRVDADEIFQVDTDFDWDVIRSKDAWNVIARSGGIDYYRMWLWKSDLPWYFADDRRHETIHMKDNAPYSCGNLPRSFRHVLVGGGNTWVNPDKFFLDGLELEQQVVVKQNFTDAYHLFYVGKSYHDGLGWEDALKYDLEFSKEIVNRACFFFSRYIKRIVPEYPNANLHAVPNKDEFTYYALYLMGNMCEAVKEYDKAVEYWKQAFYFDKDRNESLMKLCHHYLNRRNDVPNAYLYSSVAVKNNNPFPDKRVVWIETDAYADSGWKALDFYRRSAYLMGYHQDAKDAGNLMLSPKYSEIVPSEYLEHIRGELQST